MIDPNIESQLVTQKLKQSLGEMQFQIMLMASQIEARDQHIQRLEEAAKPPSKPPE